MWSRRRQGRRVCSTALGCALVLTSARASAQSPDGSAGQPRQDNAQHQAENGIGASGVLQATVNYTSDLLADIEGGARRGVMYDGRLGLILDSDLAVLGWTGATAHLSLHAIHGTGLSGDRVGNLLTVSGLEARPTVRLFNLWVQQQLGGKASLRVGQFTAAQEFVTSSTANLFVNSTFGWPASFAVDLPSGGPAYPLAAPGARLSYAPTKSTTVLVAVFAGDPAGPGSGDPQRRDRSGLNGLRLTGRPFVIGEVQRQLGPSQSSPVLKLGGWAHFNRFDDLRFDTHGRSLADPANSAHPLRHSGDTAVYAILDGGLWAAGGRALSGFIRVAASPSDRNQIDRYLDFGLSLASPFAARPDDTFGVAVGYARISPDLRALTAEGIAITGQRLPLPSREAVVEVAYQLKLRPNISLQPDLQYVSHPNAGAAQAATLKPLKDAIVAGVRTSIRF